MIISEVKNVSNTEYGGIVIIQSIKSSQRCVSCSNLSCWVDLMFSLAPRSDMDSRGLLDVTYLYFMVWAKWNVPNNVLSDFRLLCTRYQDARSSWASNRAVLIFVVNNCGKVGLHLFESRRFQHRCCAHILNALSNIGNTISIDNKRLCARDWGLLSYIYIWFKMEMLAIASSDSGGTDDR